jgi:glutathione S-transferase
MRRAADGLLRHAPLMPEITLHVLPPSHPCMTAIKALELKRLEFERVDLAPGAHIEEMTRIYGARTVPGMLVDGEPVHGSRAILARLEELVPDPPLYPADKADAVREAERWGDEELQDLGRRMPWGSLHFRPEALGTFGGAGTLDPAGTDFAIRTLRASWKYHNITAQRLYDDLQGLPEKLDHVDGLIADGVIGGEQPNAADLQIGATLEVLLSVADLRPLLRGRPAERLATQWFPGREGEVPAGAFPAGWVPALA